MSRHSTLGFILLLITSLFAAPVDAKPARADMPIFEDGKQRIWLNSYSSEKSGVNNRDPNWDWTVNQTYTLQSTSGTFPNVRLPYYAGSGPAAAMLNDSTARDIEPEDGWELVLRNFGPGAEVPFFMLYNKYRGILRVFYYSTLPQTFTRAVARLRYQTQLTSRSGAHFTFLDKNKYVNNYDPARSQVVVGSVAYHQWAYFDFDVSGYDPTIGSKNDPTFVIEIAGVTQTDLTATGEVDLITGPVSAAKSGGGFNVAGAFSNIKKRNKDVKKFKNDITGLAESAGSAWWAAPIKAIKGLTEKSWFKALGPVAGFLEYAIGGGSKKSTLPAPLSTKGNVTLRGTLTTSGDLYTLILRVPGSNHVDPVNDDLSNVLPLYDDPLGVLNVQSAPSYSGTVTTDSIQIFPTGPWNITANTSASSSLQIVYNTTVFQSANVKVAWAPYDQPAVGYVSVSSFNSGWSRSFSGGASDADLYIDLSSGAYFSRIAIKAELTPVGAASGLEPTTLYKAYTSLANISLVFDPPSGGGGGGGGGGIDPCIFCGRIGNPGPEPRTRPIDGLIRTLERAQLERPLVVPQTLDEHIDDYVLILAPLFEQRMDPALKLEIARDTHRDQLAALGLLEEWSEEDLRILESLALRKLAEQVGSP